MEKTIVGYLPVGALFMSQEKLFLVSGQEGTKTQALLICQRNRVDGKWYWIATSQVPYLLECSEIVEVVPDPTSF